MFRIPLTFFILILTQTALFSQINEPEAGEWDEMLQNSAGWLGGDGIYSVEMPKFGKTLLLFSDTLVGTTKNEGQDFDHFRLVNHSMALLDGKLPEKSKIRFLYHEDRNLLGYRCWLQDGTIFENRLWTTGLAANPKTWKPERVDAVSVGLKDGGEPDFSDVKVDSTAPLLYSTENLQAVFGCGILENGEIDGYTYIYGYLDHFREGSRKDLIIARVKRENLGNFAAWEFYDGVKWMDKIEAACSDSATLARGISPELSVCRIPSGLCAGRFLLVYTEGGISPHLAYRVGETPVGPFAKSVRFYTSDVPEELGDGIMTYNGKAHPALSTEDALLVSYNVNRLGALAKRPTEYRPRFVWLKYAQITVPESMPRKGEGHGLPPRWDGSVGSGSTCGE